MLFGNDSEGGGRLRAIRDIVEIVAIVAAGFWAFYVFIYENRIVPAQTAPNADINETIEKVSEHNGLIGVRLITSIKNSGTVRDNFLAFFVTVGGVRITPTRVSRAAKAFDYNYSLSADYQTSPLTPVYTRGFITDHGDKNSGAGLSLEPGSEDHVEDLFYVKAGQFDVLRVYVLARYTRSEDIRPTRVKYGKDGLLDFANPHVDDVQQVQNFPASLDLHGK